MALPASNTDETVVAEFLTDYYRDFSSLDIDAILPYFHEPCLIIGPQGVLAAPTRSVLATSLTPVLEGLRDRGYGRSDLSIRQLKSLSPATIFVTGIALRFKVDGQPLEQAGVTYLLQKAEQRWKIAALVTHDADKATDRSG
jgi:ketosteroid isomerase-like protein